MAELDQALQDWLRQVKAATDLSFKDKSAITSAGAEVFKKKLEDTTRRMHYSNRRAAGYEHMADSIEQRDRNVDGKFDGSSTVGFQGDKARIARYLNDGTKYITADHFVETTREEAKNDVFAAEKSAYDELMKKRGG